MLTRQLIWWLLPSVITLFLIDNSYLLNIGAQTRPELVAGRWFRPEITDELGDLLYSLCLLAEVVGVDLDEAFQAMLHKYEQRWQAKGHIGSQILD